MLSRLPKIVGLITALSCTPYPTCASSEIEKSSNLRGGAAADTDDSKQVVHVTTNTDSGRNLYGEKSVFDPDGNDEIIPTPRIVNGGRATRGRFPYYTSIYTKSWWGPPSHTCGGSLIARDVVLCAAHCYDPRNPPDSVRVGAYSDNDYSNSNGGQRPFHDSDIKDIIIHPRYNTNTLNYDFALFIIEPVRDPDLLRSIVKIDTNGRNLESYDSLTAIGLGRIYTNGPLAEYLQEVELKYLDNCGRYFRWPGTITSQMMCAMDRGEDACQGDSGGPLFLKGNDFDEDVQVGVVSWGAGRCASGIPGVYSRVSSVSAWIKQEVCDNSFDPPSDICPNGGTGGGSSSGGLTPVSPQPGPPPRPPVPTPTPAPECETCFWIFCWPVAC